MARLIMTLGGLRHDLCMPSVSSPNTGPPTPEPDDLLDAFDAAIRSELTRRGWLPAGRDYILPLASDFDAYVRFNLNLARHPIEIVPAIGMRYVPVQDLLANLLTDIHRDGATMRTYVAYLTPSRDDGIVEVDSITDASRAAAEIVDLVYTYGLPFAHQHDNVDALLAALSEPRNSKENWQRFRLAGMRFLAGDLDAAETTISENLAVLSHDLDQPLIVAYHRLAHEITARRDS